MCGRYVAPDQAEIERKWHIGRTNSNPFARRWNTHPDSPVPVLRFSRSNAELELTQATWRFVPGWWSTAALPKETHVARLEEAAGKPMWRDAMRRGRCLMPATAWYEWAENSPLAAKSGPKQPFVFRPRDGGLFCFAGLHSWWRPKPEAPLELRCALLTVAADAHLAAVHDRMPVVLPRELEAAWLDAAMEDGERVTELARSGLSTSAIEFHPVDRRVNDVRNDDERLTREVPIQPPAQTSLF